MLLLSNDLYEKKLLSVKKSEIIKNLILLFVSHNFMLSMRF